MSVGIRATDGKLYLDFSQIPEIHLLLYFHQQIQLSFKGHCAWLPFKNSFKICNNINPPHIASA